MNELLGLKLVEAPVVCLSYLDCIYRTIESNDSVDTAVRAERGLSNKLTVRPLLNGAWGEFGKAIETYSDITCEQLLPVH